MANLVVLCGISGSGKTTWARKVRDTVGEYFGYNIVSTDSIRGELFGDESCQLHGDKVFEIAYSRLSRRLNLNQNVIFDATNLTHRDRIKLIKKYRDSADSLICVCFNCSVDESMEHQKNRERKVPYEVVEKQFKKFQIPSKSEGWDEIYFIKSN